ncbi:MAG: hypothetical protein JKY48_03625 [Flavobacteriales bacterium]|nr:hypothetical protein [Flavobacteriales bacterium]
MSRYNSRAERWMKSLLPVNRKKSYQKKIDERNIIKWEESDKLLPPPHAIKVRTVTQFQKQTNYTVLVETGTFMGDMILSQLKNFDTIYSIELSKEFWENAQVLFNDEPKVKLLNGDSGEVMHKLIKQLSTPAVFWLDGHYSGANTAMGEKMSPIYEELRAIFSSTLPHCLLIDDARLFNGTEDYPKLEELKAYILENRPNAKINVASDTISVTY